MQDVLVIGSGIFGVTAAIELRERGYAVTLLDQGPIPYPDAASTDLNKAVRMEYGADEQYTQMVAEAIIGWRRWNARFAARLYEETGVLLLSGETMGPGGFEYESLQTVRGLGHPIEQLSPEDIRTRFGAWRPEGFSTSEGLGASSGGGGGGGGCFNQAGGYTRSGLTVETLAKHAEQIGVRVRPNTPVKQLLEQGGRVHGAETMDGVRIHAEHTVLAAGVWSRVLVPDLTARIKVTAHPMFYFRPEDPVPFRPPAFSVFTADVANTGYYGFPVDPVTGLWKIAKHDAGDEVAPDQDRGGISDERVKEVRAFLRQALPGMAEVKLEKTCHCFYTDMFDGHFLIDRHPEQTGLTVATGGCGHAMKMGPVLGPLIADAVEGQANPWLDRFAWRTPGDPNHTAPPDAARAK